MKLLLSQFKMHNFLNYISKLSSFKTVQNFSTSTLNELKRTPLNDFHISNGGKMINFGGWNLPLMYKSEGIIFSHLHTRTHASLFDVSHMGQLRIYGKDRLEFIETLVPSDIKGLKDSHMKLTILTNKEGGIIDDTIITKNPNYLSMVINGACREKDIKYISSQVNNFKKLGKDVKLDILNDYALIALQGPDSISILKKLNILNFNIDKLPYMSALITQIDQIGNCTISRCGYTGEEGFEISVQEQNALTLVNKLLSFHNVKLAGLGARDSLRLEAGYCLYGKELNESTTPIEAGLSWTIGKRRREEGGFFGADKILMQLKQGVEKKRIGIIVDGKLPPTEGVHILNADKKEIGYITSSVFSPSLQKAISMGYVQTAFSKVNTEFLLEIRGKLRSAKVSKMPFLSIGLKT